MNNHPATWPVRGRPRVPPEQRKLKGAAREWHLAFHDFFNRRAMRAPPIPHNRIQAWDKFKAWADRCMAS